MKATTWKIALKGAIVALAVPSFVSAQEDACKINDGSPYQLASGRNYVTMAASSRRPDEVPKHLAAAVKVLTDDPSKIKNEVGRQYLLLRVYTQYLQQPNAAYVMKRGDMGFTQNPQGTHNLLLAVDSAATAVQAANPACTEKVSQYRDRFFGEVLNKAIAALGDEKYDSASYWAHQSLLVNKTDPRPWNVLMSIYQTKEQVDSSRIAMLKVIELAGNDTAYLKVAQQSRYNLAVLTLKEAEAAEGAAKDAGFKTARALLEEYLKLQPGDPNAAQALGRVLTLSGDTAAIANIYRDMLQNPAKFTAIQLFEGASNAAASKRLEDAAKLFEAGLTKNPYHRIGLQNAASVYFEMKDPAKMEPVVRRLVEVDPNSASVWRTYGGYWQLMNRAETDAAKKKTYADSTLAAIQHMEKLPRVDIIVANRSGDNFVIQGSLTNNSDKAQTYTIKFELLDEKGQPVGTKEVAVGPVDAGANASFAATVESPKAVAFRYAPLR